MASGSPVKTRFKMTRVGWELLIVLVLEMVVVAVTWVFREFDAVARWTGENSTWVLNLFLATSAILALAFVIFSIRRWRELRHEIGERLRAEEGLRESEARLKALIENAPDGVHTHDLDGVFLDANMKWETLVGYSRDELVGKNPVEVGLIPEEYIAKNADLLEKSRQGEPTGPDEMELIRKDGTRIGVETSTFPVRRSGRVEVIGITRDITERKQAEAKLKQTLGELARSNAELEQFAYVASHDLQEPLRMVTSYVQLLARRFRGKLDRDADEFIAFAVDGATRMQDLINDLLAYSRVGTRGKPFSPTDPNAALQAALSNLRLAIDGCGAVVDYDPLPIVSSDGTQLVPLFQNLVGNAIKFRREEPPRVHVSVAKNEDGYVFSVSDNGIGIEAKYHERIFLIFQRLHSRAEYPGTGIGLSICKRIIERHRGRIWVESEPGKGSTFRFTIPMTGGEQQ